VPHDSKDGLAAKKKSFIASERDTEKVRQQRQDYQQKIWPIDLNNLVFVDEAGVNKAMTRLYGRAPSGDRAYGYRPQNRGRNITMIGALALRDMIAAFTFPGGNDRWAFLTYVNRVLVPNLWEGAVVVMDNFSSHLVAGVREAIESVGARLIYLPTYSPDLSPIEMMWSKIKQRLRSIAARTDDELDEAITEAFNSISQNDILNWFLECDYRTSLI
jgi:transposase